MLSRILDGMARRRRCDVCRARMSEPTYGRSDPRRPEPRARPSPRTPHEYRRIKNLGAVLYLCNTCAANAAAQQAHQRKRVRQQQARAAEIPDWLRAAPVYEPGYLSRATADHNRRKSGAGQDAWANKPPYLHVLPLADATDAFVSLFRNHQYWPPEELTRGNPHQYASLIWTLLLPRDEPPTTYENVLQQNAYIGVLGGRGSRDVFVGSVFSTNDTDEIAVLWCWRALETYYD